MEYKRVGNTIVLRAQMGEEIISLLTMLISEENITCGRVSGIGATDKITIGLYNVNTQEYHKDTIEEEMEILSLSGNLTRKDGAPYVHVHGSFATLDRVYGGHVNEVWISATAEIIIDVIDLVVDRKIDKETGLNLIKL
ncbi:MAG: DNA-binding protein [Clostridia bacterium]|nr:DNA-binding protein [Clostridia bacterium]